MLLSSRPKGSIAQGSNLREQHEVQAEPRLVDAVYQSGLTTSTAH